MNKALTQYLEELLGPKKALELRTAMKHHKTIVISGVNCSGKTTLCNVLKTYGFRVTEDYDVYKLNLDKPLDSMVPNKIEIVKANVFGSRV